MLFRSADTRTRNEIEKLISGEEIVKEIRQELTYSELDSSIENLWSVLFTTGYLTQRGQVGTDTFKLAIPNLEIRRLFIKQIREWFRETFQSDGETLNEFCNAFPRQNPKKIEELFGDYLWNTISIRDTAPAKKENFYHGILLGLLGYKSNWLIKSNAESGIGAYGHFPRPSGPRSPARQGHIKRPVLRLAEPSFLRPANQCC